MRIKAKRNITVAGFIFGGIFLINMFLGNLDLAIAGFVALLGLILNLAHIYANGGRMAVVDMTDVYSDIYCLVSEETKLRVLCDRINIGRGHASIGDVIIICGLVSYMILLGLRIT